MKWQLNFVIHDIYVCLLESIFILIVLQRRVTKFKAVARTLTGSGWMYIIHYWILLIDAQYGKILS